MRLLFKQSLYLFAAAAILAGAASAYAQSASTTPPGIASVSYPIAELGSCSSRSDCKIYCDFSANHDACFAYAEAHGLMSKQEVSAARAIVSKQGPGGCSDKSSCTMYCQSAAHTDECVSFAQKHGTIATSTATIIKKIQIEGGPGGCKGNGECRAYCATAEHLTECQQFGQASGIIQKPADPRIKTLLAAKAGPGGCKSSDECKTYCSDTAHGTECRQYALDNGLITRDQFEKSEKVAGAVGPGGCQGSDCKAYCQDSSHQKECYDFAVAQGLVSRDAAAKAQAVGSEIKKSGGPGGCTSAEGCRAYCSDSMHIAECKAFSESHGAGVPAAPAPGGANGSSTKKQPDPTSAPLKPAGGSTPDERAAYCRANPSQCSATGAGSAGNTSSTANLPCNNIDECRALCARSATACAALPAQVQEYIQANPQATAKPNTTSGSNTGSVLPPPPPSPPPTTGTNTSGTAPAPTPTPTNTTSALPPPAPAATVAPCNTLAECKILCTNTPSACAGFPPDTLNYILNSGTTHTTAGALWIALESLFGI